MKKITSATLLLVFLAFTTGLHSQNNFVAGTVTTLEGEDITGQINYLEWEGNPEYIDFKTGNETTRYQPEDLKGFHLQNGEWYESYLIEAATQSSKTPKMSIGEREEKVEKAVFLRVEIKGVYNLLSYKEKDDDIYFFIQKGTDKPTALTYEKIYDQHPGGRTVYRVDESYKRQLNFFFSDCENFYDNILKTRYNRKGMKALFSKYSACKGENINVYESKKEKTKASIYLIGGANYSIIDSKGELAPGWFENFDSDPSLKPSIGVGLNLVFPRNRGRWSLNNELALKFQSFSDEYAENIFANFIDQYDSKVSITYLKLNTLLKGKFRVSKFAPFAQVGFSNGIAISDVNQVSYERYDDNELVEAEIRPFIGAFKKYEVGVLGSLGVEYDNRYVLELRYEWASGFENFLSRSVNIHSFYALVGYLF